ncbi:MAG: GMC family oxidoreductase [Pseudomonadota bacterium]
MEQLEYDYVVVGSGFGGSVAAMRLSQKGYRVAVIESGKRWRAQDFAPSNWNLRKFLWMPDIGLYGFHRMNVLKDVFILGGAGVGGGSINYANTLYVPPDSFFEKESVKALGGKEDLQPYYSLAKKMLGVTQNPHLTPQDHLLKETVAEYGRDHTFTETPVGVYFGKQGTRVPDPYFFGEGPDRTGCELCGACMTGCRKDAKNTLDKNYLFFAEKFGAAIIPENRVMDIVPLSEDGSKGYRIKTRKTTGSLGGFRGKTITAQGVVLSAGTLGTLSLLMKLKENNRLPRLSDALGKKVRTNSEALIGVESRNKDDDFSRGVAITSSVFVDDNTHIEPVRYAEGNDAMSLMITLPPDEKGSLPRPLRLLKKLLANPGDLLSILNPVGWAKRTIILLVMQTHDNYINIFRQRRILWPFGKSLTSCQATDKKNPVHIPIAYDFARRLGKRMNGIVGTTFLEAAASIPMTAHIMGGCAFSGPDGVIDERNRVRGYQNMLISDGSQIPENLGVNPSLSITALSERALSFIPPKPGRTIQYLKAEKHWGLAKFLTREPQDFLKKTNDPDS